MKIILTTVLLLSLSIAAAHPKMQVAHDLINQGKWQEAQQVLLPIAETGDPEAQYLLAKSYLGRDDKKALEWGLKAAQQNNPESQLLLGKMYSFGNSAVPRDVKKAIYWYQRSADNGNSAAKRNLSYLQ